GILVMAALTGPQYHFAMVGAQESTRSMLHLAELFRLADQAGLLANPELATRRMKTVLASHGLEDLCAISRASIAGCPSTRRRSASRVTSSRSSTPVRSTASVPSIPG